MTDKGLRHEHKGEKSMYFRKESGYSNFCKPIESHPSKLTW